MTNPEGTPMTEALDTQASDLVPAPPPPPSAIGLLRAAVLAMDDQRAGMVKRGDTTALAWGGAQVALVAGDLADLLRQVRSDLAVLVENDYEGKGKAKLDIEGLGRVEIDGGWERKNWESAKLLRLLLLKAIVDPETGELTEAPPSVIVSRIFEVLNDCLPITGSLNWRTGSYDRATESFTGLKKYGVDDEDFCDRIDKPKLARIPKIVRSA